MTYYYTLSRSKGLSYRDIANDNLKRWPSEDDAIAGARVVLNCPTGYWVHNGVEWLRPYDYLMSIFGADPDINDIRCMDFMDAAPDAGIVDIGVPMRYLPDRCQDFVDMYERKAAR